MAKRRSRRPRSITDRLARALLGCTCGAHRRPHVAPNGALTINHTSGCAHRGRRRYLFTAPTAGVELRRHVS